MPRKLIYNPADGQYVYEDDAGTTSPTPDAPMGAIGRAIGILPGETGSVMPAGSSGNLSSTAGTPSSLGDFGDYDPTYEAARTNYTAQQNQAEEDYSSQLQRLSAAFDPQFSQLEQTHGDDLEMFQNQMAQNGILRSSNNLYGQGKINSAYQNQLGGLTGQRQQSEQYLAQQRLQQLRGAQQGLTTAEGEHAGYLANIANQRAQRQAATDAANRAAQELNGQLLTTPTGQYQMAPGVQYASPTNPVGITQGGTSQAAPTGGGLSPYPSDPINNGADLAAQLASDPRNAAQFNNPDPYSGMWQSQNAAQQYGADPSTAVPQAPFQQPAQTAPVGMDSSSETLTQDALQEMIRRALGL